MLLSGELTASEVVSQAQTEADSFETPKDSSNHHISLAEDAQAPDDPGNNETNLDVIRGQKLPYNELVMQNEEIQDVEK